jgi:carbamoyltransferase
LGPQESLNVTSILGLSAFYHDAAAALVVDGEIVAAAQEERFTRRKHDARFPQQAIEYCLAEAGLGFADVDYVGFYEKPLRKFERLLETYLACAPRGFRSFLQAMPVWLRQKLHLPREIRKGLGGKYTRRIVFTEHHESHAASAFFPSPFEEAAILTLDGVGEWATASLGVGRGNRVRLSHELHFPHSLGLLYSAFTYFCGFKVNSGEYKLMGLAPYGEPRYADRIREHLLDLKADGSFRLDMRYFGYGHGLTMTNRRFEQLFERPRRLPESPLTQSDMDLAASIQKVTEEIVLRAARHAHAVTGMRHLCLAGGVALNCVANGRLLREGPFEDIWIQPAAGDAGGALGVAQFIWHQLLDNPRDAQPGDAQKGSRLGPRFGNDQVRAFLDAHRAVYHHVADEDDLFARVADHLVDGKVVGWMQGRMEFGPRALGSRSILGDARLPAMQATMNLKIKFRESFRPFAPAVLEARAADYFGLEAGHPSPYMLLVAPVVESRRTPSTSAAPAEQGLDRLAEPRSEIPAVTHVDHSARVQTVDAVRDARFEQLLRRFDAVSGCPVVINTSFNVRGEPIVCTPEDAHRCFLATDMDVLVMGDYILLKSEQPDAAANQRRAHLERFELD